MDAQFWIYVAIGAIYFLSRFFKKPEEGAGEVPETPQTQKRKPVDAGVPRPETRQLTFEELLREITEGKEAQRKPAPEPELELEPVPAYEKYEQELAEEDKSLEEVSFNEADRAVRWKSYEEIPPRTEERRSLEETLRLEDTKVDFGKFAAFENTQRKKLLDDYIKLIRNPQSLRQAVVMSEILKPKF